MPLVVVTGGSAGLGASIISSFKEKYPVGDDGYTENNWRVVNWDLSCGVNVADPVSVGHAARRLKNARVDMLINCAGINKLDFLPQVTTQDFNSVMGVNANGIFNTVKELLQSMVGGTVINIVSDAARRPMTTSISYNASKAAALAMTMQMHRELFATHGMSVFSISPCKLMNTRMSTYTDARVRELRKWTKEEAAYEQKKALNSGKEVNPEDLADFICWIAEKKQRQINFGGCDIPYGGA